jgi:hypothetical protein
MNVRSEATGTTDRLADSIAGGADSVLRVNMCIRNSSGFGRVDNLVRFRQSDDETLVLTARDVAIFGRPLNYFISSYDRSAASGGSGLAGKSVRKTANVCDPNTPE